MTRKMMDLQEFRKRGYLQEVNRCFFHPLGLALAVQVNDDGTEELWGVLDARDDPEGWFYAEGMIDPELTDYVKGEFRRFGSVRVEKFGWTIQPPDQNVEKLATVIELDARR